MKYAPASLAILAASLALPAHAIEFWHSNTVWAGQGQCSAVFTFDSNTEDTKNLQVAINLLDKAGKKLTSGTLEVQQFGQTSANRYADAFLESEETCADDLIVTVTKATAIINGKRVDLLKTKTLTPREFKPFKIRVGK